jgi:hypothetical protein
VLDIVVFVSGRFRRKTADVGCGEVGDRVSDVVFFTHTTQHGEK